LPEKDDSLIRGSYFAAQELREIQETACMFPKLSRLELAKMSCENINWVTPAGEYKLASCKKLLKKLESQGIVTLPAKQEDKIHDNRDKISFSSFTDAGLPVEGGMSDFGPIILEPVLDRVGIRLWNEYVHRYHLLGYKRPFGAHQRYFIVSGSGQKLGCFLFAASTCAVQAGDQWIGWTETDRSLRLNLILNNTWFPLFPWVRVKNMASKALSLAARRIRSDWQARYGYSPVLLETFVDLSNYRGTCYKAANWLFLGRTKGRGRTERHNKRPFSQKDIYIYPLVADFRSFLKGKEGECQ